MRFYLSALTILLSLFISAQSYTVIHSIGKIYDASSGSYLKKGSKVSESAQLKFETEGAKAAVLSSSRGRFIIQKNSTSSQQSDLAYTLSSVISPVRGRLSTRAGGINNQLDFQKHFGEGPIAIVGDSYKVAISPNAYPMNDQKFFYAQYSYNGERINKKLSNDGDSLLVEVASFFAVDKNPINPAEISDAQLFYYDAEKQESISITSLNLNVVSNEELRSLVDSFSDLSKDQQTDALHELINDLYGRCSKEEIAKAF